MADDGRTCVPRGAMGCDQHGRVQFKMPGRIGRDIGGRADRIDAARSAQQHSAHLVVIGRA
jgi:hypothetical protein